MPDRNVTFLILAKDFASRTMNNIGDSTDRAAQKLRNMNTLGLGPLATAGAALGPALLPVLGGAVVATAALGASFTAAGAAAGVFGAVTASVFGEVQEASKKSETLRDKISLLNREIAMTGPASAKAESMIKSRDKALLEYRARLAELPAPTRAAVLALDSLKTSWEGFVDANKPAVLGLMTRGMSALRAALPGLQPLFDAGAAAAERLMTVFERFVGRDGIEDLAYALANRAGPAFRTFGTVIANFGVGLGNLAAPFLNITATIEGGLVRMSAAFRNWANEAGRAGVERFITWAKANAAGVGSLFVSIASSLATLAAAAAPLAPISVKVAAALATILDAIPQPVLTAMIGSFIAWSVALQAAMVVTKVGAAVAIFGGIITGVTTAMLGHTLATNASTAAKVAFSVATGIATAATWALDAALVVGAGAMAILTAPITLVILGIVALGAALYLAWTRSETFRRIVTTAFTAVGNAAVAVGRWFQQAWQVIQQWWTNVGNFFTMLPSRIMSAIAAFPGMLFAYWRRVILTAAYIVGFGIGAIVGFFQKLPGRIMGAIRSLQTGIPALWSLVWTRSKAIVTAGVSAVVGFFASLPGRAHRAAFGLLGRISSIFVAARTAAVAKARELVFGAVAWLSQLPGRAARAIASVPGRIRGVFAGAGSWLVSAGYNLIMGLVHGIGSAVGAAVGAARSIASSVVSGVRAGLGIASPSKVMRDQVGAWIPPGIAAGITKTAPGLMSTVDRMVADLVRTVQTDSRVGISAGVSGSPLRQSMPSRGAGGGSVVILNVNGALDPQAVGKQIVDLLARWAQSQGKTFALAQ